MKHIQRKMLRQSVPSLTLLVMLATSVASAGAQQSCRVAGESMGVEGLSEASGIAVSRRTPGLLWSHNDSGEPVIVAVDSVGTTRGLMSCSDSSI